MNKVCTSYRCWFVFALVAASAVGGELWTEGPVVRRTLAVAITLTATDSLSATVALPLPEDGPTQKVTAVRWPLEGGKGRATKSDDKQARIWLGEFEVVAGVPLRWGYEADLQLTPRRLDLTAAHAVATADHPGVEPALEPKGANITTTRPTDGQKGYLVRAGQLGEAGDALEVAAQQQVEPNTPPLERARRAFALTQDRLDYQRRQGFKGAARAWTEGVGECTDYAAVFVALCRSMGVPARPVAGYWWTNGAWDHHAWAEFYVAGIGWIPADPTQADADPAHAADYFAASDGRRVGVCQAVDVRVFRNLTVPLLQEYAFRYQGFGMPRLEYRVAAALP